MSTVRVSRQVTQVLLRQIDRPAVQTSRQAAQVLLQGPWPRPTVQLSRQGTQILLALRDLGGGTPSGPQITWFDGTGEQNANVEGWWDGAGIQNVNIEGWWDGDSTEPLG